MSEIDKAAKVPLIEQLLAVPEETRISWELINNERGGNYPFGYLCHQAAAELEQLRGEIAAITEHCEMVIDEKNELLDQLAAAQQEGYRLTQKLAQTQIDLAEANENLLAMVNQYCARTVRKTGTPETYSHDFMSTGEAAFEYLVDHGLAMWCR
jgi:septal ring factor EnvC (AmiA/AmiB activator)